VRGERQARQRRIAQRQRRSGIHPEQDRHAPAQHLVEEEAAGGPSAARSDQAANLDQAPDLLIDDPGLAPEFLAKRLGGALGGVGARLEHDPPPLGDDLQRQHGVEVDLRRHRPDERPADGVD